MPDDFGTLRDDIEDARNTLSEEAADRKPSFTTESSEKFGRFLFQALDSLYEVCEDSSLRPDEDPDTVRDGIYASLQKVRRINSALKSDDIPRGIYYFLADIKSDLSIDTPIELMPVNLNGGTQLNRSFRIYKLENSFNKIRVITLDNIWDEDVENVRVISLPRAELQNPLSYSILVHECFHLKSQMVSKVMEYISDTDSNISMSCSKEAAIDLLSLNYLGPVYADRLIEIPNKIGEHKDAEYPDYNKRLGYSIQYLDWVIKNNKQDVLGTSKQKKLNSINDDKYDKLEQFVKSKLEENQTVEVEPFDTSEFEELQHNIGSLLSNVPTYSEERNNIAEYMGMPHAGKETISTNLDKLFIQREKKAPIPMKPILTLNFYILMKNFGNGYRCEPALNSFKKWYVADKTRGHLS